LTNLFNESSLSPSLLLLSGRLDRPGATCAVVTLQSVTRHLSGPPAPNHNARLPLRCLSVSRSVSANS